MKFYILGTDIVYTNYPKIKKWFGRIDPRDFNIRDAHRIPDGQVFMIHESKNTVFTSIVDNPFPLITAEVRAVFDMYEPHIIYKEIVLLDAEYKKAEVYYLPILEEIQCLREESEFNLDKSIIKKGIIDFEKTEGRAIFRLGGFNHYYMVGRLDLVESILKRDVKGIGLTELVVYEGGQL
ncbi:MAG: hypothetical protein J1F18_02885 [Lachnospiraceae bacterium]|nr:hypothetical protein [Lachnospiraceae bacterium]